MGGVGWGGVGWGGVRAEALKAAVKAGKTPEDALEMDGSLKTGFDRVTTAFQRQAEDDEKESAAGTAAQQTSEARSSVPPPKVTEPAIPDAVLASIGDEPMKTVSDEAMDAMKAAEKDAARLIRAHATLAQLPTGEQAANRFSSRLLRRRCRVLPARSTSVSSSTQRRWVRPLQALTSASHHSMWRG